VCAGNQDGTADIAARIDIAVTWLDLASYFESQSCEFNWYVRPYAYTRRETDRCGFAYALITTGPLEVSAVKLEVCT